MIKKQHNPPSWNPPRSWPSDRVTESFVFRVSHVREGIVLRRWTVPGELGVAFAVLVQAKHTEKRHVREIPFERGKPKPGAKTYA